MSPHNIPHPFFLLIIWREASKNTENSTSKTSSQQNVCFDDDFSNHQAFEILGNQGVMENLFCKDITAGLRTAPSSWNLAKQRSEVLGQMTSRNGDFAICLNAFYISNNQRHSRFHCQIRKVDGRVFFG